jgi:hypothetical protein
VVEFNGSVLMATKRHKKHKKDPQSCAFCASLWLLNWFVFFEQKVTKGTKKTFHDCCSLRGLRFLLFKIMVRFFSPLYEAKKKNPLTAVPASLFLTPFYDTEPLGKPTADAPGKHITA